MFRNYLVTAIRNFARHKLYSFINIVGLAVGLACAIFIALYLRDELSFDKWIPNNSNVYRLETTYTFPGNSADTKARAYAPFPLAEAIKASIPEVDAFARSVPEDMTVRAADRQFPETVNVVDPNFFSLIELPLVRGDAAQTFKNPETIVLAESYALKYFGTKDVLGRVLTVGGVYPLVITGVMRDLPHNTQFTGGIFISNKSRADHFTDKQQWFSPETFSYIRLTPGANPSAVVEKTRAIIRRDADSSVLLPVRVPGDQIIHTRLIPLTDVHLGGAATGMTMGGSWSTIYGFAIIAVLILLIACFNFTNLATARAQLRAREVSLRKVVGAKRRQLIAQFLGESVLTALVAMVFALVTVEILLPAYSGFLDRPIAFSYIRDWPFLLGILAVTLTAGVLGGVYPALVLSGFRPAMVLKTGAMGQSGSGFLRVSLVVAQFAISIGLGIAAIVVFAQIRYINHLDLGFDRDNMVVIEGVDALKPAARDSLMRTIAADPNIAGVAQSSSAPFHGLWQGTHVTATGNGQDISMRILTVSPEFMQVYGIPLLTGRELAVGRGSDVTSQNGDSDTIDPGQNILVNAAAVRDLGLNPQQAIGKTIYVGHAHAPARIVGVVGDTKFYAARDVVDPTVYADRPDFVRAISVHVKGSHIPDALATIDRAWSQFAPTIAIRRHFLDDSFDQMFATDQQQGGIFAVFVGIAIFIACLGLFGLAAFTAQRRTKEIGIRKVFGARIQDIVRLLLWQFSIPVLIANAIAWPIAWYYLNGWLENYAYRISLNPLYFIVAGALALLIAWATVFAHALRVARANPVHALRYE